MKPKKKKSTQGGARKGAGRHPINVSGRKRQMTFKLSPESQKHLDALTIAWGKKKGPAIEEALARAVQNMSQ